MYIHPFDLYYDHKLMYCYVLHFTEEDGVYVDAEGVQLVANVSVCIGAQLDCSLDSQQATVSHDAILRLLYIL